MSSQDCLPPPPSVGVNGIGGQPPSYQQAISNVDSMTFREEREREIPHKNKVISGSWISRPDHKSLFKPVV